MRESDCRHLDDQGICQGKYKGFGCIGDKCLDPTKGPGANPCKHGRADGYCKKHKKFQCEGEECRDYQA
ncbi:MAG: hypothetical protein PHU53_04545 [Thermoplasmata archaeon]|nr:hypothetical protein [Thermoplasmata archaeon]